ncbi:response regulator [Paucimonas lemoignei]|uniref:response regulator n=1 Tax=Paucimonas lemoignei TaxID=29443 RepID=UPI001FB29408|nr:response regulator [Paucimonas lemoignei]
MPLAILTNYMHSTSRDQTASYIGITLLSIAVFIIDFFTRVGIAEWVFYLIPVIMSAFQRRKYFPFIVAAVQLVLIAAGFVASPEGINENIAMINRAFCAISVFAAAFLAHRVVAERLTAQRLSWLQQGHNEVATSVQGEQDIDETGDNLLRALARYVDAQVGVLYRIDGERLVLTGSFAMQSAAAELPVRHGLAGEAVRDREAVVVRDIPDGYIKYGSATGGAIPRQLLIAPLTASGQVQGVLELGFAGEDRSLEKELALAKVIMETAGIGLRSALYRRHLKELLEETQRQAEELQAQHEELRVANEELEEQGRVLLESQTRLENQQAELEQTNVQLEEQAQHLERQKAELVQAQRAMEINAEELAKSNRYKSEFLANMSHELRTPLNSSLILSQILIENKTGTLTEEQVRYARTIHASNNDLLALINEILDLSKIEAGHVDILPEPVSIAGILEPLRQSFEPIAKEKDLAFTVGVAAGAPATFITDVQRLQQILKNLLSNAFKFTERGEVILHVAAAANDCIAFSVRDSGIGIPEHQQGVIFEAFRQADGTTSRKYGGTGLGLSISRELARLLGGDIQVQSTPGLGSTFTVVVSANLAAATGVTVEERPAALPAPEPEPAMAEANSVDGFKVVRTDAVVDHGGRQAANAGLAPTAVVPAADYRLQRQHERLILVIEDDERFASILRELVQELKFDCVVAANGAEAIRLAKDIKPNGILLDVGLPDQSGLSVLEQLKRDPVTRHIPIHVASVDDHIQTALELGAVGYVLKPVAREELIEAIAKLEAKSQERARQVLVVEDDVTLRENIATLLQAQDVEITTVGTVADALQRLSDSTFDCMVMDLTLPDASGYDLLEKMAAGGKYSFPPVIVYTGRVLTRDEEQRLRRYSKSIIVKGARSPERLMDEVTLFLHRVEASMPPDQKQLLLQARQRDVLFEGRRILLAEDDVRNIFALSSVFEPLGAKLEIARNGKEALVLLERDRHIDLVLMDLMMPEMDGLTAMREIRNRPELARLPIIALTAKAMPDDRKSCLDAGANDYIAKPIDVERLISLCRVWLPK